MSGAEAAQRLANRLRLRVIGLLFVVGGGLMLVLISALAWFAYAQDTGATLHAQRIASGALRARIAFMNRSLTQYAVWDDPIDRVVYHLDRKWADTTIGPYVYDELHIEQSYVVMRDGSLRYAMRDRQSGAAEQRIDPALARLAVEAARAPQSRPMGRIGLVDGHPAIIGVQKIVPSTERYPADTTPVPPWSSWTCSTPAPLRKWPMSMRWMG
jgi:sensor domain CHASE-containing protein